MIYFIFLKVVSAHTYAQNSVMIIQLPVWCKVLCG